MGLGFQRFGLADSPNLRNPSRRRGMLYSTARRRPGFLRFGLAASPNLRNPSKRRAVLYSMPRIRFEMSLLTIDTQLTHYI